MQNTDEQIRKMLELKETIIEKMSKCQDEIDFLQKNLDVLDVILMVGIIIVLEDDYTICEQYASDINLDGIIDILDIISLVNLILS